MEISITYLDSPSTQDSLVLESKLGEGKFNVYKVHSSADKTKYAFKVFPKDEFGTSHYLKEKATFFFNHENLIKQVPMICHRSDFSSVLIEFAEHGDFFDLVTKNILDSEILIRSFFHQLVQGMEYLHGQGFAHLDLKLDNLMLGSDLLLKIIDFDQTQSVYDKTITSRGTKGYRAPEVRDLSCTNMKAADIYSVGIILFALKAKRFPFIEGEDPAGKDLRSYSVYIKNKKAFWDAQREDPQPVHFEQDFIELVNGMVHEDPKQRLELKDIKESKWFNGPVLSSEALKAEMEMRLKINQTQRNN